jgi:hypothetical protein
MSNNGVGEIFICYAIPASSFTQCEKKLFFGSFWSLEEGDITRYEREKKKIGI